MKKKNLKKLLLAVCCAALLVCVSIGATVAYLTSKDEVKNTFTVGKVNITLDETDVTLNGTKDTDTRVDANDYKLMPGHEYIKDPIVHVTAGSEPCWVFISVKNEIAAIEADTKIAAQITAKGWTKLKTEAGVDVYYKQNVEAGANGINLPVFDGFKIDGNVDSDTLATYNGKTIVVTAYAIQADGFTAPEAAWTAVSGAYNG